MKQRIAVELLEGLLEAFVEMVASRVVERLHGSRPDMVDQRGSPLGSRRHCNAVKRRLERGAAGAAHVGRRYLLTPEALTEELAGMSQPEPAPDAGDALRVKLGLLKVGRRG